MKICVFVHHDCRYDTRVLSHAKSLAGVGHDVQIVASRRPHDGLSDETRNGFAIRRIPLDPMHRRWMKRDRLLRQRLRRIFGLTAERGKPPLPHRLLMKMHRPLMVLDYSRRAYREVKDERGVDVYHAHDLPALTVAAKLAKRNGGRLVCDLGELFPESAGMSKLERAIWRLIERRLIRRPDHLFVCSESKADVLRERYTVQPVVLLDCRPRTPVSSDETHWALHHKIGVDPSMPVVLHHGALHSHRGLNTIVDAARQMHKGVVVFMGNGRMKDDLERYVADSGLADRVLFTDPVPPEQLLSHVAGATLGVIATEPVGLNRLTSLPNRVFECMAVGVPLVATRLVEHERFIEGLDIGLLFEAGDSAGLAGAIDRLLSDEKLHARCSANARAAAEATFNWEAESRKLLAAYEAG